MTSRWTSAPADDPDAIIVCTAATRPRGLYDDLVRDLAVAHIPHHHVVVTVPREGANINGTLGEKLAGLRRLATSPDIGGTYKRIVLCDAFDVMYVGGVEGRDELIAKIPVNGVVVAAERNAWPCNHPALRDHLHPPNADSVWCWCNGGFIAGGPGAILEWCDWVEKSPGYGPLHIDQMFINWQLMLKRGAGPGGTTLHDTRTEVVYCLSRDEGEIGVSVGEGGVVRAVNTVFGTRPLFLHFNGSWPVEPYLRMVSEAKRSDAMARAWQ
jgi:hypothetical protein